VRKKKLCTKINLKIMLDVLGSNVTIVVLNYKNTFYWKSHID